MTMMNYMQSMMGWDGGSIWGGFVMVSASLFWMLLLIIMVLLIAWLVKQIKK